MGIVLWRQPVGVLSQKGMGLAACQAPSWGYFRLRPAGRRALCGPVLLAGFPGGMRNMVTSVFLSSSHLGQYFLIRSGVRPSEVAGSVGLLGAG